MNEIWVALGGVLGAGLIGIILILRIKLTEAHSVIADYREGDLLLTRTIKAIPKSRVTGGVLFIPDSLDLGPNRQEAVELIVDASGMTVVCGPEGVIEKIEIRDEVTE